MRRRWWRPAGAPVRVAAALMTGAVVLSAAGPAWAGPAERAQADAAAVERVLVISLPYVAWSDLDDKELPHLNRLLDESSIANLSTRAPTFPVDLAGGYVTLGSGDKAKAAGSSDDGAALEVDEKFGRDTAAQVFEQRTAREVKRGIVHLGIARIADANANSIFDADIGVLGDTLADAGFSRAVIANGDGSQPPDPDQVYRRDAVAALMDSDGTLRGGRVGPDLHERDAASPYGLRTDLDTYEQAFSAAWKDRSVVLVEASDLVRVDAYASLTSDDARATLRRRAFKRTDALVGRLLEQVDPARDAIIVVGPAPSRHEKGLTVASVRAPGFEAGFLRSRTTQRSGYAQLIDIAPTILRLVGVARPDSMRGRVLDVGDGGGSAAERREFLADGDTAARLRNRISTPVAAIFIAFSGLMVFGAVLALWRFHRLRAGPVLPTLASILLAYIPAVYLERAVPTHDAGIAAYYGFVIGLSILLGLAARALGRRHELDPLLIGLGTIIVILVGDVVLLGSDLQFNSGLGFSPEVAGRFVGYGNAGYAALAAAALLFAGLIAHRVPGRRGTQLALAVLVVVLLADGAPFWGADVGGVLSMVPAFGVAAVLLLGRRVTFKAVFTFTAATVVAIGAAMTVDLLRPAGQRTHLGRLAEQVRDEGTSAFTSVIRRKIDMNLSSLTGSNWRIMIPIGLAFVAYLVWYPPRHLVALLRRIPQLRCVLIGLAILMVLGYALNDSGVVVPGVMFGVLLPVLVTLVVPERAGSDVPAPPERATAAAAAAT